jgi:hypothetical protein
MHVAPADLSTFSPSWAAKDRHCFPGIFSGRELFLPAGPKAPFYFPLLFLTVFAASLSLYDFSDEKLLFHGVLAHFPMEVPCMTE